MAFVSADRSANLLAVVSRQRQQLQNTTQDLGTNIPQWKSRTLRMLKDLLIPEELNILNAINTPSYSKDRETLLHFMIELEAGVKEIPEHYALADPLPNEVTPQPTRAKDSPTAQAAPSQNVFVVHGHDALAKVDLARTLERLKLVPIVLHEQANEGKTIIEKFERDASKVSFAVVLLTPDDSGHPAGKPGDAKPRARQNVILELGYFSGALGRSNVCVLYKGDVEIPSDYLGVVYVNMDDSGAWRFTLAKELKQAGLPVDLNNLA